MTVSLERVSLGRVGVWSASFLWGGPDAEKAAVALDELGYGTLWLGASAPDLALPARLLAATERIVIATGIVNVWATEPGPLAERFHTTPETLAALNPPGAAIGAGSVIQVPDVADIDAAKLGADERGWNATLATLAVAPDQPRAEKVVVSKSGGWLRAYDGSGKLLVQFPATMGSEHDPLPIGHWKILGVSKNPDFHYNPKLFWDVKDSEKEHLLKPGPNGPVGVVWLDLSKEHYGIHGTGEPSSIGNSESHGCVRLTNWDAARLAQMVKAGTQVVFQR